MGHPDLPKEQAYVDHAYECLDRMRAGLERVGEAVDAPEYQAAWFEAWARKRIATFEDADRGLCFRRLDLDGVAEPIYVGRRWVHEENAPLVVNWQAPAARPFYTATVAEPLGVERRRRFRVDGRRLLDLYDEPLDGSAGEVVHGVADILLEELERSRDEHMRDIVATIQADQYKLITRDPEGVLIIQGGPGTGKTAVGLHRASWLLYTHREQFGRTGVLVVGPNPVFMDYVSHVLPMLGEDRVEQRAIDAMADAIAAVVRELPAGTTKNVGARIDGVYLYVTPEDVAQLTGEALESARTYADARERLRTLLARRFYEQYGRRLDDLAFRSFEEVEKALRSGGFLNKLVDSALPRAKPEQVVKRALAASGLPAPRGWSSGDLALIDEARALLTGVARQFGHVIVDEAQDLTPMQLRMLARRSTGSLTILGDIAQASGPVAYKRWEELLPHLAPELEATVEELRLAYRVPRQMLELALPLLPVIAPDVAAPIAYRDGDEPPRFVEVAAGDVSSVASSSSSRLRSRRAEKSTDCAPSTWRSRGRRRRSSSSTRSRFRPNSPPDAAVRDEEHDEQHDEQHVTHQHEPRLRARKAERVVPVVPREPPLRPQEREREQQPREPAPHERHERDQPDEELRREHLAERDERDDRGRRRLHELFARPFAPREHDPDREQHGDLQHALDRADDVRRRTAEVLRAVARHHVRARAEHVVRGDEQRRAEALHLQRTRRLASDAVPHAAGREHEERQHDREDDGDRNREAKERLAAPARPPDVRERERDEHAGPDLRRDACAEQRMTDPEPPADERGDRTHGECRRPVIEARQHDRPEQERRDRRQRERAERAAGRGTKRGERGGHREQRQRAARPHERAEVVLVSERGNHEERQRAGRILEREVAVRHLPARHRVAVLLVHRRVDDLVALEEPVVERGPGGGEQHERPDHERRLQYPLDEVEVRDSLRVVLLPVPQRERRAAPDLPGDGALPEDAQRVSDVRLEQQDREGEHRRDDETRGVREDLAPRRAIGRPERCDDECRELRPRRERDERSACRRPREQPEAPDEERRQQRVVRVRVRDVLREWIGHPRERERRAELGPAEAPSDQREAEQAEEVEHDRGRVRGREVVPLPGPAEDQVLGDVRLVGDGPVRVAAVVRRLAPPVRLHAVPDLAVLVLRSARLEVVLDRHVPIRRLAVDDPLGADHARITDVDDVRRARVEADAEADREHGRGEEDPRRPGGPATWCATGDPDVQATREEVGERRVCEGSAREDVAAVEEPQRDAERQHRDQVERAQRERSPPVHESDQEERAEAEPDARTVDLAAAERTAAAARHRPGDLRARPRLRHVAGHVVDATHRDLARVAPPDLDRPVRVVLAVLGVDGAALPRVTRQPVAHLRICEEDRLRLLLGQMSLRRRRERCRDHAPVRVVDGPGRRRGVRRGGEHERDCDGENDAPAHASAPERPELVAEEVEGHHEHDRDRLRDDLAPAEPVEEDEQPELVHAEREQRHDEEARALIGEMCALAAEGPVAVPPVGGRGGDDERDEGRDVRAEAEQQRVDDEVDGIATRADRAELRELHPVVRRAQSPRGARHCDLRRHYAAETRRRSTVACDASSPSIVSRVRPFATTRPEIAPSDWTTTSSSAPSFRVPLWTSAPRSIRIVLARRR